MECVSRQMTVVVIILVLTVSHTFSFKLMDLSRNENAIENSDTEKQQERKNLNFRESLTDEITVVREGENIVLECEAGGRPTPTIHWLRNGSRIIQGTSHSVLDEAATFENSQGNNDMSMLQLGNTQSRLYLDCLTPEMSGEYACVADIPEERIQSHTYLEIDPDNSNRCPEESLLAGSPARIHMWEVHRLEFEGADVQLYCRASGYPKPVILWYDRNNEPITAANPQYRLLKNGDLLIKNVSWFMHMGEYKCVAHNANGDDEVTSFVYPTLP